MFLNGIKTYDSNVEKKYSDLIYENLVGSKIPSNQMLSNLGLFLTSKNLSRILFFNYIYQKIVDVQGQIFDFGTRWGNNMSILVSLRSIYEPFNRHRIIVGFDTFEGFPEITPEDGQSDLMIKGNLKTYDGYGNFLNVLLGYHEQLNPLSHIKKYILMKGDACIELELYLQSNKHVIASLVYFDFDLYKPTKECLILIKERLVKGSIMAFDELNDSDSPGETLALQEVFGLNNIKLKKWPYVSRISYFVYGD